MVGLDDGEVIGRAGERATLREALERALRGRGGIVVIRGEAGIGKSTLAEAAAERAQALGFDVLFGRAWEFADAPAYFPLWSALRALGLLDMARATRGEAEAFQLWEATLGVLAAAEKPILWRLEDLHAADAQTLALLLFLGVPIHALPVLIVMTVRTGDPRAEGSVGRCIARIARDGVDLTLEPLPRGEVAALAARAVGRALDEAMIDRLMDRTNGVPLFVVECGRAARQDPRRLLSPPASVVELVGERLEQLPLRTRLTLNDAAVLGREFRAGTLAGMRGVLPASAIDELLPALRMGLVSELAPGYFAFSHALVRDAIYERMSREERRKAHAAAEDALATLQDDPAVLLERAQHALEAVVEGREARTLELTARALEMLEASGAHDRAYALASRLLQAQDAAPGLGGPGVHDLLRAARLARSAGLHREAERHAEAAMARTRAAGDARALGEAVLILGANLQPGVVDAALVARLEEARARLGGEHPALACRLTARLAAALQPASDPRVPVEMARGAITDARRTEDTAVLAETLYTATSALIDYVPVREIRALSVELLELATARGDHPKALRALARLVMADVELGDLGAYERDTDRLLAFARQVGHPRLAWRPLLLASMRALAQGDFASSERHVVEVEQLERVTDDPALALSLYAHRCVRAIAIEDEETLLASIAGMEEMLARVPNGRMFVSLTRLLQHVRQGDREGAREELARLRPFEEVLALDASFVLLTAEALALAGSAEQQRERLARIEPRRAEGFSMGHIVMTYEGPVSRILGLLRRSLGDLDGAIRDLGDAFETCRAHGLRPFAARIGLELGSTLIQAGRIEEGRGRIEAVRSDAEAMGLRKLAERFQAAVASSAGVPATGPVATAPTVSMASMASSAPSAARAGAAHGRAPASLPPQFTILPEGATWRVMYSGRQVSVRDSRGMQLLARLVERPREELHVLALASDGPAILVEVNAEQTIDAEARKAYRRRIADLEGEIGEARQNSDLARADALERERTFLEEELARAFGLGGGARKLGSVSERARINVQRRLKDAIGRIREVDAEIGAYLDGAVRTGTYCVFRP